MESGDAASGFGTWSTVLIGLVVVLTWYLLVGSKKQKKRVYEHDEPPQAEIGIPFLGPATAFGIDPVGALEQLKTKYGECFSLNLILFNATFLLNPVMYKHFYNAKEEELNFMQGVEKFMKPIFGIPKEDEFSKEEFNLVHIVMRQALGLNKMKKYRENALSIAEEVFAHWAKQEKINLLEAWAELVNTINTKNFMGEECCKLYSKSFSSDIEALEKYGTSPLALMMPSVPTPDILRCNAAKRRLNSVLSKQLEKRRNSTSKEEDVLQLYADAKRTDGTYLSSELVLNGMIAIFFGAFHNTTNTLTWLSATLADEKNKSYLDRVKSEISVLEEILGQCLKEISRLYFTVMVPPRKVMVPFEVESKHQGQTVTYTIPEGAYVCIAPIITHRDETIFPNPLEFNPDRFTAEQSRQYEKSMQFVQFGFGKHRCTGEHYAIEIIQACLALLLKKYKLELLNELPPPLFYKPIGTAIPKSVINAKLIPLSN